MTLDILFNSLLLLFSIYGLWQGAVWLVDSASVTARHFGIPELVIGLTIVAFGTSAPEFAVTVTAALKNQADISVANIVGSNIFNLGFILGTVAIIRSVSTSRKLVLRDGLFLLFSCLLLVFFLKDLFLEAYEGIILNVLLLAYLFYLFYRREAISDEHIDHPFHWYEIPKLLFSLLLVTCAGYFLVQSSVKLASLAGISEWVIGITVVAMATSAPEMVTSLVAVLRDKHAISAGNLIGSNLFNLLGVLGLASWIHPLHVENSAYISMILLTILTVSVLIFMRSSWRVSRSEGVLLIAFNLSVYLISILF